MIINKGTEQAELDALQKYRDPKTGKLKKGFGIKLEDFYAYMPKHTYIFAPTNDHWPAESVNAQLGRVPQFHNNGTPMMETKGKKTKQVTLPAHMVLDERRAVQSIMWAPGEPQHVNHRVFTKGGWLERPGLATYNEYRPPNIAKGNEAGAQRWKDLLVSSTRTT